MEAGLCWRTGSSCTTDSFEPVANEEVGARGTPGAPLEQTVAENIDVLPPAVSSLLGLVQLIS